MRRRFTKAGRPVRTARLAAAATGMSAALAGAAPAVAGGEEAHVPLLSREGQLERSLDAGVTRERYEDLYRRARRLDVAPRRNPAQGVTRDPQLEAKLAALRRRVERAEARARRERRKAKPDFGTPESVGVSQATLEAIAACESGGDPTAVDPSGTYRGKYQFDLGTWASVGGAGDPAAAPEAEQDYRAALLLSQAGSSPWPICG